MIMPIRFRKMGYAERLMWDLISIPVGALVATGYILIGDALGLLAFIGIGSPSLAQAFVAGLLWSAIPKPRVNRYVEIENGKPWRRRDGDDQNVGNHHQNQAVTPESE